MTNMSKSASVIPHLLETPFGDFIGEVGADHQHIAVPERKPVYQFERLLVLSCDWLWPIIRPCIRTGSTAESSTAPAYLLVAGIAGTRARVARARLTSS